MVQTESSINATALARRANGKSAIPPASFESSVTKIHDPKTLFECYPITRAIVGDRYFERLVFAFTRNVPYCSGALEKIEHEFPWWLDYEHSSRKFPYLAEIAHCECNRNLACTEADVPALDIEDFLGLELERRLEIRLRPHPGIRFVWMSAPALEIWLAHTSEQVGVNRSLVQSGGILFTQFCRAGGGTVINAAQHRLLCGARVGETFGEARHAVSELYPDTHIDICFTEMILRGAFVAANDCDLTSMQSVQQ